MKKRTMIEGLFEKHGLSLTYKDARVKAGGTLTASKHYFNSIKRELLKGDGKQFKTGTNGKPKDAPVATKPKEKKKISAEPTKLTPLTSGSKVIQEARVDGSVATVVIMAQDLIHRVGKAEALRLIEVL